MSPSVPAYICLADFVMNLTVKSLDRELPAKISIQNDYFAFRINKRKLFLVVFSFLLGKSSLDISVGGTWIAPPQSFLLRQNYCSIRPLLT